MVYEKQLLMFFSIILDSLFIILVFGLGKGKLGDMGEVVLLN